MAIGQGFKGQDGEVWDAEAGEQIGEPLKRRAGGMRSVAFSPDGNRIVTFSSDETARYSTTRAMAPSSRDKSR